LNWLTGREFKRKLTSSGRRGSPPLGSAQRRQTPRCAPAALAKSANSKVGAWPFKNDDGEAELGIDPLALLHGRFPRRAFGMVMEWAAAHQQELLANWELMRSDQPPNPIDPLD
jgi:hypothetical protein